MMKFMTQVMDVTKFSLIYYMSNNTRLLTVERSGQCVFLRAFMLLSSSTASILLTRKYQFLVTAFQD